MPRPYIRNPAHRGIGERAGRNGHDTIREVLGERRELRRDLRRVGYRVVRQKGSHEQWAHPLVPTPLTLDGRDGEDADHYQERAVRKYIRLAEEAERRQQP